MRALTLSLLVCTAPLAFPASGLAGSKPIVPRHPPFRPASGFVPDEATAIKIAVAVWEPIYGAAQVAREKPYRAFLHEGVWFVEGSVPPRAFGGVAYARIAQRDGRILAVLHTR